VCCPEAGVITRILVLIQKSRSRKQLRRGSVFWVVARTVVGFRRRKRFRGFCAFADGKCRLLLQLQGCEDSFVVLEPL